MRQNLPHVVEQFAHSIRIAGNREIQFLCKLWRQLLPQWFQLARERAQSLAVIL